MLLSPFREALFYPPLSSRHYLHILALTIQQSNKKKLQYSKVQYFSAAISFIFSSLTPPVPLPMPQVYNSLNTKILRRKKVELCGNSAAFTFFFHSNYIATHLMDMTLGGSQVKRIKRKLIKIKAIKKKLTRNIKMQNSAISRSYSQLHISHKAHGLLSKAETKTACCGFPQYSSQVHTSC